MIRAASLKPLSGGSGRVDRHFQGDNIVRIGNWFATLDLVDIVHAVDQSTLFLFAWSILMTIVLLLGLIKRQESGPAGLGWETVALGVIYVSGVIVQFY